jgi:excisionase family DNA binding protein
MDSQDSQRSSTKLTPQLPTLVDIETVARSLDISMRQVRRFVADGTIPYIRVGNLIRFDLEELNLWIDARRSVLIESQA